jgi:hypothetical protein
VACLISGEMIINDMPGEIFFTFCLPDYRQAGLSAFGGSWEAFFKQPSKGNHFALCIFQINIQLSIKQIKIPKSLNYMLTPPIIAENIALRS